MHLQDNLLFSCIIISHVFHVAQGNQQPRALEKSGAIIMTTIHESSLCMKLNKYLAG